MATINLDLTEEQLSVMRVKKKLMVQVYPLIKLYTTWVDAGSVPTPELELQIISLLNELALQVIGGFSNE